MEIPIHKPIDHVLLREQLQKLLLILDGATRTKDELRRPHVLVRIVDFVVVVLILILLGVATVAAMPAPDIPVFVPGVRKSSSVPSPTTTTTAATTDTTTNTANGGGCGGGPPRRRRRRAQ